MSAQSSEMPFEWSYWEQESDGILQRAKGVPKTQALLAWLSEIDPKESKVQRAVYYDDTLYKLVSRREVIN